MTLPDEQIPTLVVIVGGKWRGGWLFFFVAYKSVSEAVCTIGSKLLLF